MRKIEFHKLFSLKLFCILLCLNLLACGDKKEEDSKENTSNTSSTSEDKKLCLDKKLNESMDTAWNSLNEEQRENSVEIEVKINEAQKQFEASLSSCGLSEQEKDSYLAITNVPQGVMPDSIESTEIAKGKLVVMKGGSKTIGFIEEVFQNGFIIFQPRQGVKSKENKKQFSVSVFSRRGLYKSKLAITGNNQECVVLNVFADGLSEVDCGTISVENSAEIFPSVHCVFDNKICVGKRVLIGSQTGSVTRAYTNNQVLVSWDSGNESYESAQSLIPAE